MRRDRGFFRDLMSDLLGRAFLLVLVMVMVFGAAAVGLMVGYDMPFAGALALTAIGIGALVVAVLIINLFDR